MKDTYIIVRAIAIMVILCSTVFAEELAVLPDPSEQEEVEPRYMPDLGRSAIAILQHEHLNFVLGTLCLVLGSLLVRSATR